MCRECQVSGLEIDLHSLRLCARQMVTILLLCYNVCLKLLLKKRNRGVLIGRGWWRREAAGTLTKSFNFFYATCYFCLGQSFNLFVWLQHLYQKKPSPKVKQGFFLLIHCLVNKKQINWFILKLIRIWCNLKFQLQSKSMVLIICILFSKANGLCMGPTKVMSLWIPSNIYLPV